MTNIEIAVKLINVMDPASVTDEAIKQVVLALLEPAEPKATPKPKTAEPKSKKKQLDHGKLIACYKAGWPIAKIADELGCTSTAVRQHLHKEGLLA